MSNDSFFKHNDKVYSENLNDSVLVGNAFTWTVDIDLPTDNGGVFPSSTDVVKAKVADVSATPNSNLSIGSTIVNNSGASQEYRLTVYPNFNRYGGFTFVELDGDGDVIITEKGASNPVRNNLDYSNLGNVAELRTLKEYDLVVTIPSGGSVEGLGFGFQSGTAEALASISEANVRDLTSDLDSINSDLSSLRTGKANVNHTHTTNTIGTVDALENIGTSGGATQRVVNHAIDDYVGSLSNSIANLGTFEQIKTQTSGSSNQVTYTLYANAISHIAILTIDGTDFSIANNNSNYEISSFVPTGYRPIQNCFTLGARTTNLICYLWNSGTVGIANVSGSSLSNQSFQAQITYAYR